MLVHYLTIIPDKELDKNKMKLILDNPTSYKKTKNILL